MPVIENIYVLLSLGFVLGICVGSFVTMASHRLPLGQDIVFKPSYCPNCDHKLGTTELVPVFTWVFQKGKCRACKTPIHVRYPLTELACGLVFAGLAISYGATVVTLLLMLLAATLAILIVTDLEHFIIPDSLQIAIAVIGIAYRFWSGSEPEDVAASAGLGLALGLTLHFGYLWFRKKDALGWGDVKFLAAAGIWLTITSWVPFLFFSGLIGVVTGLFWRFSGRGNGIFPFGPALAVSLFLNVLFPDLLYRY